MKWEVFLVETEYELSVALLRPNPTATYIEQLLKRLRTEIVSECEDKIYEEIRRNNKRQEE